MTKPLLHALHGKKPAVPPIWLMRQAGRYLPEYRKLRAKAGSFLDLCFNPDFASEVTLQPTHRFGLDGAILFSDILVIPYALGQALWFEEGSGPKLKPIRNQQDIRNLEEKNNENIHKTLNPIYQTLKEVKKDLPKETTLIGFAGAPWTVATYMVEGGTSRDFATIKHWAYSDPEGFQNLIDCLTEATSAYLIAQIDAGAEALQIFDTWAGSLPASAQRQWCLNPVQNIIKTIQKARPGIPIIAFPKGAGPLYATYAQELGADAISLDPSLPLDWARNNLQSIRTVQGNLDPQQLVVGGQSMHDEIRRICNSFAMGPFIFNLGHGVVPQTPPDHVADLVAAVREQASQQV